MKKCIVIGGGFSGLASAVYLSESGFQVELIEASRKLGGRAYSFKDSDTTVDNGQHILMGCYCETLNFLKLIGAESSLKYQKYLDVCFLTQDGREYKLDAGKFIYPFNLIYSLLNYKYLSVLNRIRIIYFISKLLITPVKQLKNLSVFQWLKTGRQNKEIRKAFWEIIAVGALNTNIKSASAEIFASILKKIFFRGNFSSTIILPALPLSTLYCEPAKNFIENLGGEVCLSETVQEIKFADNNVEEIITNKRIINKFDFVIAAVPPASLALIAKEQIKLQAEDFVFSAIINIHIWLKKNSLKKDFYGFIDSPVHWVFNNKTHITVVISDANYLVDEKKEKIFEIVKEELYKYLNIKESSIKQYSVIKEKRATFVPSPVIINKRPSTRTGINNFFLAGDWTSTSLPSTIESAVLSGKLAAEEIIFR